MKLVPPVSPDDKAANRRYLQKLASKLGPESSPVHAGLTLTDLTASRLVASDANKTLESSDIVNWIDGTVNQIIVTDDGDGTVTLSLPQDIHVDAHPEFAGLTIKDSGDNIVFFVDDDEVYYTLPSGELEDIVTGNPFGLWLPFYYTYTV